MTRRKLVARTMSHLQWFDRLEALGMEYEEALYVFHDRLAPLDEAGREREYKTIAMEQQSASLEAAGKPKVIGDQNDQEEPAALFGELIHSYSRAQAIEDGVLVDVSKVARGAGLRYPVAVTRAVWDKYVAVPAGVECQDESGRLWDVLWMLSVAIRASHGRSIDMLHYQLYLLNDNRKAKLVTLKAVCGPGDEAEPVITVMLPDED